jgi:hypothetical protein
MKGERLMADDAEPKSRLDQITTRWSVTVLSPKT